jgi:two-component sensor histidine kinase
MVEGLRAAISRPFDSLRQRLAVLFAVVLLPPTVLSLYLAWSAFEEQSDKARLSVRQFASLVSAYERDFFNDTRRLLVNLAADPAVKQMAMPACRDALLRALENFPEYISISATDREGTVKCTTAATETPVNLTHRRWFQAAIASPGFTLSDYTVSQDLAEPVIVAASPIRDDNNEIAGVLHIEIDLDWLSLFVRASGVPPDGSVFLLDKNGIVLTSSKFELDQTETMPNAATLQRVADRQLTDFEAIGNDGQQRVYSSVALPHGNVIVLFGLPSATTLGWIERDLLTRLLSLAAIWLAGIFAAIIGTRLWVTRWVSQLRRTARAYSRGDFSARVDFSRAPVELRDLGTTLVNMADRLEVRERDLRRSIEQKDTLLKEIHHRVKNNLQTITSLLNIKMRSVTSDQAHRALEEVQTRVRALGLVHHYLYESDDVRFVELKLFVGELCQVLHDTLSATGREIRIESDVQNMTISSERAVPIALLITEAVTNSYKHAFPDGRLGRIQVAIHRLDDENALLTISDDGVGYASEADLPTTVVAGRGVGLSLISAFARQLGEDLAVSGPPGTTISLRLRLRAQPDADAASAADTAERAPAVAPADAPVDVPVDVPVDSPADADDAATGGLSPAGAHSTARSFGKA